MKSKLNPSALHPVHYVVRFHEVYGHAIAERPQIPDAKTRLLRCRLLMEEAAEFCRASGFPVKVLWDAPEEQRGHTVRFIDVTPAMDQPTLIDLVEVADALGDINVVNNGAALAWGVPIDAVDGLIHASNMSKLGDDGKPLKDEHGKTVKGPGYRPPTEDIRQLLVWAGADPATLG